MTRPTLIVLLLFTHLPASARADDTRADYLRSPVFYQLHGQRYGDPRNIELLRENKVVVDYHDPVELTPDFNWAGGIGQDFSWWVVFEELRFLLPVIASDDPADRKLARHWFMGWHTANRMSPYANKATWWALSTARRAMVLVYYLKREEMREPTDGELVDLLRASIREHQRHLAQPGSFEASNNHGVREALALFETTRVCPDDSLRALALERLRTVTHNSVSALGSHLEHAPAYHYVFLRWLDETASYLETIEGVDPGPVGDLGQVVGRMKANSYYYQDHRGVVPPVGDSDPVPVEAPYRRVDPPGPPSLFDPEAGYAVYKANDRDDRRYVVFCTQNREPLSKSHFHDDVLAVFFSYNGETILGDQGRYRYTWSADRRYFVSPPAHDTVYPYPLVWTGTQRYHVTLADSVWSTSSADTIRWAGAIGYGRQQVRREVLLPAGRPSVIVRDSLWTTPGAGAAPDTAAALAMTWNVGPDVVELAAVPSSQTGRYEWRLVTRAGREFRLSVEVSGHRSAPERGPREFTGSRHPMMGWYSPLFGRMEPSTAILFAVTPEPSMVVTTRVSMTRKNPK